jgi:uncharacterized protein YecT (DUF1311 family)
MDSTTIIQILAGILFLGLCLLYFYPTFKAMGKRNTGAIFALNLLTGWSTIGWVVALIWALKNDAVALRPDEVQQFTGRDRRIKVFIYIVWSIVAIILAIVVMTDTQTFPAFQPKTQQSTAADQTSQQPAEAAQTTEAKPDSVAVSKPVEQVADAPASRPLEDSSSSETSHPPTQQVASSEGVPQQPDETSSKSSAPGMLTSASSGTFAPSFDCKKASTGSERLICSNQQLASLDVQLMQAYRRARRSASNKDSLRAAQIDWIKNQRDACSTAECMIGAYKTRIQSLEAITP